MIDSWIYLAKIVKPNHKKKGLVLKFSASPFCFSDDLSGLCGLDAYIVPPEHDLPWKIRFTRITPYQKSTYFAVLEGYHDYSKYYDLSGKRILFSRMEIVDRFGQDVLARNYDDILGLDVVDVKLGKIGVVSSVMEGKSQAVLEVQTELDTVMIPYVDEYVKEVLQDEVIVEVPQSLLDLNRG